MLIMFASVKQIQLTYSLDVQLDLGYPATSYPDISIIGLNFELWTLFLSTPSGVWEM